MKVPNLESAIVDRSKICDYLLNPDHRFGAGKAKFFLEFGFDANDWTVLAIALKAHAAENEVVKARETGFGPRFEVEGEIAAPDGRRPRVRTIWQVDAGQSSPRLITAYPSEAIG